MIPPGRAFPYLICLEHYTDVDTETYVIGEFSVRSGGSRAFLAVQSLRSLRNRGSISITWGCDGGVICVSDSSVVI